MDNRKLRLVSEDQRQIYKLAEERSSLYWPILLKTFEELAETKYRLMVSERAIDLATRHNLISPVSLISEAAKQINVELDPEK